MELILKNYFPDGTKRTGDIFEERFEEMKKKFEYKNMPNLGDSRYEASLGEFCEQEQGYS